MDIDFRHLGDGLDIKYLWELNRHVWWVPLAQAWQVSGQARYLALLGRLIDSWLDACPYARGANWSSPVEHGIRLINWSIVWHLTGGRRASAVRRRGRRRPARALAGLHLPAHPLRQRQLFLPFLVRQPPDRRGGRRVCGRRHLGPLDAGARAGAARRRHPRAGDRAPVRAGRRQPRAGAVLPQVFAGIR
nr:heparinase II/III family protein [Duganella sp. BJB1802]